MNSPKDLVFRHSITPLDPYSQLKKSAKTQDTELSHSPLAQPCRQLPHASFDGLLTQKIGHDLQGILMGKRRSEFFHKGTIQFPVGSNMLRHDITSNPRPESDRLERNVSLIKANLFFKSLSQTHRLVRTELILIDAAVSRQDSGAARFHDLQALKLFASTTAQF